MKKTKTSISVTEELWREYGAQCKRRGMDLSGTTETLIRQFLENLEGGRVPEVRDYSKGFNSRNKRQHVILEIILESQTPGARDAITKNLRMFGYSTLIAGRKTDKELDRDLDILIEKSPHWRRDDD